MVVCSVGIGPLRLWLSSRCVRSGVASYRESKQPGSIKRFVITELDNTLKTQVETVGTNGKTCGSNDRYDSSGWAALPRSHSPTGTSLDAGAPSRAAIDNHQRPANGPDLKYASGSSYRHESALHAARLRSRWAGHDQYGLCHRPYWQSPRRPCRGHDCPCIMCSTDSHAYRKSPASRRPDSSDRPVVARR